ncbi:MAG: hypothetical protein NVSMB13_17500 [Mycobacteriales bacterium]
MESDSLLHPIGPLPEVTYWRRRVVVIGASAAALLLAGHAVAGGDSGPRRATVSASSLSAPAPAAPAVEMSAPAADSAAAAPAGATGVGPGGAASPPAAPAVVTTPAVASTPAAEPVGDCADGALTLTTSTDKPAYPVGSAVRLTLGIRNTGAVVCRRDLGAGVVGLIVTSGSDRIWSSIDCGQGGASVVTLAPGESRAVQTTWAGLRSKPGCPGQQPPSPAGTYRVTGRVGSLSVPGAVFHLT